MSIGWRARTALLALSAASAIGWMVAPAALAAAVPCTGSPCPVGVVDAPDENGPVGLALTGSGTGFVFDLQPQSITRINGSGQKQASWPPGASTAGIALGGDGNIYAAELTPRVEVFDQSGNSLRTFPIQPGGTPQSIAVDRESGDVYIGLTTAQQTGVIQAYHADGSFLTQWTLPEIPTAMTVDRKGIVWVAGWDTSETPNIGRAVSYTSTGTVQEIFRLPQNATSLPSGIVLVGDTVYITDFATNHLYRYTNGGVLQSTIGSEGSAPGQLQEPEAVSADQYGDLVVADTDNRRLQRYVWDTTDTTVKTSTTQVSSSGTASVKLACRANGLGACAGRLSLALTGKRGRTVSIGGASYSIRDGKTATVRVKLRSRVRNALEQQGRLEVQVVATTNAGGRRQDRSTGTLTLH
jgi:sugar lactone lactonase YvrE